MRNIMKSRIVAGIKAKYTRKLHKSQQILWNSFVESCKRGAKFIPAYGKRDGVWELTYDRGYGIQELKFKTRDDIFDFIASLC